MMKSPRITNQTLKVLQALMQNNEISGATICKITNLPSGTVYPILNRLEEANWTHSKWEEQDASSLGRPRRRYYRITAEGARQVRNLAVELEPFVRNLSWQIPSFQH